MTPDVSNAAQLASLTPASFQRFAEVITRKLGIKMSENKIPMLQGRLQRRMRALGFKSIEEYQSYLLDSPAAETELTDFINEVTTNKTDFLREPKHFDYLTQTVLPALDPGIGHRWDLRVWCAGCSSGEEPYTLAMVLSEFGEQRGGFDFSILATDISMRVLDAARKAVYDEARIEPLPDSWRSKYLLRSRNSERRLVKIMPRLRDRVTFGRLNFMDEDYGIRDRFDVIFFRNVMIYFDRPTQEKVVCRLCKHLKKGGHLFVGHSESLMNLDVPVRMVSLAVYRSDDVQR